MHTYRIVVGVDGSAGGARALAWAVDEAARRGGTVQAVTAWQWADNEQALAFGSLPQDQQARSEQLLTDAITAVRTTHPGVTVAGETVRGPAAEVLATAGRDADLLVLGSHGHGRIFHAVLGSVAEACVRAANCPVVVVPTNPPSSHGGAEVAKAGSVG